MLRAKNEIEPKLAVCLQTQKAYQALQALENSEGQFYGSAVIDEYLQVLSEMFKTQVTTNFR